jgi:hypothetical protein
MTAWTKRERDILSKLKSPAHIQRYLDDLHYNPKGGAASPRAVMRDGMAQCYSGALFGAAALRELGHTPRIMWMDAVEDDGHCIALYQVDGMWGSVAKSNFTTIRSREPIYDYHSLGLSYFDGYFNYTGKRTMRAFTVPIDLSQFEKRGWRFDDGEMLYVDDAIDTAERAWKLPRKLGKIVEPVSDKLREAGLLGVNEDGLWKGNDER